MVFLSHIIPDYAKKMSCLDTKDANGAPLLNFYHARLVTLSLFFIASLLMTTGLMAASFPCLQGAKIGIDLLYWQPCVAELHYAIERSSFEEGYIPTKGKTRYLSPDYEPGVRVYGKIRNLFCGNGAVLAYTYLDADASAHRHRGNVFAFSPSMANPSFEDLSDSGNRVKAHWNMTYQTIEAFLTSSWNISCNERLQFWGYRGTTLLNFSMDRRYSHFKNHISFYKDHRDLDVWGAGPTIGFKSNYTLTSCFNLFSSFSTTLIVGESKNKGTFRGGINSGLHTSRLKLKTHDHCVCFPGMHFMSGVSYETCVRHVQIGLRAGWEYVSWFNAPTFPYYEPGKSGMRSSTNNANLTLQGLFAGLNVSL